MVSRKWTFFPVVLLPHVAERRRDAALGHHRVRLPEKRLADDRRARAAGVRLDRGTQPGAARADDDDVVLVTFEPVGHQKTIFGSWSTPMARRRM
jgi:hypothetical protein